MALRLFKISWKKKIQQKILNRIAYIIHDISLSAHNDICSLISDKFRALNIQPLHFSPSHAIFGNISPAAEIKHGNSTTIESSTFFGLPLRPHLWARPFYMSHEIITEHQIDFLNRQNINCLYIVRDPLDTIISNASKISLSVSSKQEPEILLKNPQWVHDIALVIKSYFENLSAQRSKISILHYETII